MRTLSTFETDTVAGGSLPPAHAGIGSGSCSLGAYGSSVVKGAALFDDAAAGDPVNIMQGIFDPIGYVVTVAASTVAGAGVGAVYQTNQCVQQETGETLDQEIEQATSTAWHAIEAFFEDTSSTGGY